MVGISLVRKVCVLLLGIVQVIWFGTVKHIGVKRTIFLHNNYQTNQALSV